MNGCSTEQPHKLQKKTKIDIVAPDEKHTLPPIVLPKGLNLSLIKLLPAANCMKYRRQKHIKRHQENANSKIPSAEEYTGQLFQILEHVNYREKKKDVRETYRLKETLKRY